MHEPEPDLPGRHAGSSGRAGRAVADSVYRFGDLLDLQGFAPAGPTSAVLMRSVEDLLDRDLQREQDGFPRRITLGKIVRPGPAGTGKVVLVPTVVEDKFIHDTRPLAADQAPSSGGSGDGQVGEVIGEEPVHEPADGQAGGAGQGSDEGHEIEAHAYALGRILTEKFALPNLKDRRKKCYLNRYEYDLTDRHRGAGQVLDKKATLRRILETNLGLGRVPDVTDIDPAELLVAPDDQVYRILSREKAPESQALVFFVRDYSGSMAGTPTEIVAAQHVLIYSWLTYQYARRVETRFILHDTEAKEVPDFQSYLSLSIAGGTHVEAAYRLVNGIVEQGGLDRDYNIYVFHGTDGDDWDTDGDQTIAQITRILGYCSRLGITIARGAGGASAPSVVERVIANSRLLEDRPDLIRLDTIRGEADEGRVMEGIRTLVGA
jgi:uncharacterized protein